MAYLHQVFALLCGRAHCWAPGGESLPFCQRCAGLYVGAALALLACVVFRPRPTSTVLLAHGLLLLQMVPFGYHLVPQNGTIRTLSGQLFAAGVVYYLSLLPLAWKPTRPVQADLAPWTYALGMLASLAVLPVVAQTGGRFAGRVLAWLGFFGLIALAVLVAVNLFLLPLAIWRRAWSGKMFTS